MLPFFGQNSIRSPVERIPLVPAFPTETISQILRAVEDDGSLTASRAFDFNWLHRSRDRRQQPTSEDLERALSS